MKENKIKKEIWKIEIKNIINERRRKEDKKKKNE